MYYCRQKIKFNLDQWKKISKKIFNNKGRQNIDLEKKIRSEIASRDFQVVTGSSMRDLLVWVLKYYLKKTNIKRVFLEKYNHFSNLNAIVLAGGQVDFKDSKETKIKIVTNLHGIVGKTSRDNGQIIIEDGAHAFGAKREKRCLGDRGVVLYSFGFGKIVTCFGGGAVVTRDRKLVTYLKNRRKERKNFTRVNIKFFLKGIYLQFITSSVLGRFFYKVLIRILIQFGWDNFLVEKSILENKETNKDAFWEMTKMQSEIGLESIMTYKQDNEFRMNRARIYNSELELYSIKNGDVFFHYPVKTRQSKLLKLIAWKNNLDVQDDYCENVEELYQNKIKINGKKKLYLPTSPEIPEELIKKFVKSIKILIEK